MDGKDAKLLLLMVPIAIVVMVSGCTGGNTVVAGNGVIILDFAPDFSNVYSGDSLKLQLRAQNQGQVTAKNVEAELTNIDTSEWGTFGFGFGEDMGDMLPYDATENTPGEIRTKEWRLEAPELPKGTTQTYEPMVKVSYDYKTVAQKSITVVDEDELRRIIQQGNSLPSKPTTQTAGPLSVNIQTGEYVRTSGASGGQSYDVFPVYIEISNDGWGSGGTVVNDGFGYGFGHEYDYPVRVKVTPPNGVTVRNSGEGCSGSFETVDLWKGNDAKITCQFEVTNPPSYRQEKTITVELEYRYQTQATTQVTVSGTKEGLGFGW